MTDGNTHLDEREDWDALQEVTTELEQAEARIEELEEKLRVATKALEIYKSERDRFKHVHSEIADTLKPGVRPSPDDVFIYPDGDMALRDDIERGEYDWKSDDYCLATPEEAAQYFRTERRTR